MDMPFKILTSLYLSLLLLSSVFLPIGGKKTLGIRRAAVHFDESLTNIWPLPKQFASGNRTVTVDPDLVFDVQGSGGSSPIVLEAFERFRNLVFKQQSGYAWEEHDVSKLTLVVASDDDTLQLGVDESYTLYVSGGSGGGEGGRLSIVGGVSIEANTIYGALRGLETLSQLCTYNYKTKTVEVNKAPWYIYDEPRFSFRGLLLDSSRHFLPVNVIKQVIESMSYAKLNVLHWHIIDKESFPLEIPTYPNLWEGSYTKWERYTIEDTYEIVECLQVIRKVAVNRGSKIYIVGGRRVIGDSVPSPLPPSLSLPLPLPQSILPLQHTLLPIHHLVDIHRSTHHHHM